MLIYTVAEAVFFPLLLVLNGLEDFFILKWFRSYLSLTSFSKQRLLRFQVSFNLGRHPAIPWVSLLCDMNISLKPKIPGGKGTWMKRTKDCRNWSLTCEQVDFFFFYFSKPKNAQKCYCPLHHWLIVSIFTLKISLYFKNSVSGFSLKIYLLYEKREQLFYS